ncbi:uncharacterized protein LOC129616023 [Condylostylus longicornis]|uniref:uncharacterized protein LOC129616023 n=1 Tax=Condylostylus longicornis TaxID=2530218 RepID=UPI00244DDADD|nr:uncharacterized protein LOC129616023 [Condylostylus longicornis]
MTKPISDISTIQIFDTGPPIRTSINRTGSIFYQNDTNENDFNDDFPITIIKSKSIGIIDDLYIWIFLCTIILFGILLSITTIGILFRARCNGTRYLLLQLTFCDLFNLIICGLEFFYMNHRKWITLVELCPVYLGMDSFTNTAAIYFIIAINFHTLSTYNLAVKELIKKEIKENQYLELLPEPPITEGERNENNDGVDSSGNILNDGYLVALPTPTESVRSLTIDYSQKKVSVAVILPALFIWFIAASVSIPFFVFGMVIPNELHPRICGVMNFDTFSSQLMQGLMIAIRIIIPTILLIITLIIISFKLYNFNTIKNINKKKISEESTTDDGYENIESDLIMINIETCGLDENIRIVLKLSFTLSIAFIILGFQKMYGSLLFELISKPFMHFKYPKMIPLLGLIFTLISSLLPVIRPILYFKHDIELRNYLQFWRRKKKKNNIRR